MQKKHHYIPLIGSLYVNYLFQGIATIAIAQNQDFFQAQWSASLSQVTLVISALGLGRIISLNLSGWFSDRFGRRKTVLLGVLSYILFFIGILFTRDFRWAFVATIFGGIGNAFLDTSTYPIVVEAYPSESDNSSLSVLNKSFISIGQFILPFVTRWVIQSDFYFGWPFVVCALCLGMNFFFLSKFRYPSVQAKAIIEKEEDTTNRKAWSAEGAALMIFSFVSVSLFNIFILWIPTYSETILKISKENSPLFVSVYSIGSFISVFLTSYLVRKKWDIPNLMLVCLLLTAVSMLYMIVSSSMLSVIIASIGVGCFSAGGIWQLGLALLLEFYPHHKGIVTSFYSLTTSISVMVTPYLTGLMVEKSVVYVFIYNILLALLGFLAIAVVQRRYRVLKLEKNK